MRLNGTVKYYAQIHLQVWQNSVCTGQGNLPFFRKPTATGIKQSHLHKRLDTFKLLSADNGFMMVFQMNPDALPPC